MNQLVQVSIAMVQIAECLAVHNNLVSFEMDCYEQGRFTYYSDEANDIILGHRELSFESLEELNNLLEYINGYYSAMKKYKL